MFSQIPLCMFHIMKLSEANVMSWHHISGLVCALTQRLHSQANPDISALRRGINNYKYHHPSLNFLSFTLHPLASRWAFRI